MRMRYRTDLAIENKELIEEAQRATHLKMSEKEVAARKTDMRGKRDIAVKTDTGATESREADEDFLKDGVKIDKREYGENVAVTTISIVNRRGEELFGRTKGNYVTIEAKGLLEGEEEVKEKAIAAVCDILKEMVPFHNRLKVLVVGLGNEKITPDSLGPNTVSKVEVTRHMFIISGEESDEYISCVSGLAPGVTGTTGIETFDIIKKAAEIVAPEAIIIIDSLAARNIDRVSTTIQINDTGISPGAGLGNNRKELSQKSLGIKVVAIGVPTVIDSGTLVMDALSDFSHKEAQVDDYVGKNVKRMIVTPTDIDMIIKEFSDVISKGVNKALHPGI